MGNCLGSGAGHAADEGRKGDRRTTKQCTVRQTADGGCSLVIYTNSFSIIRYFNINP